MSTTKAVMSPNILVNHLQKPRNQFTANDILKFVEDKGIKMFNFRYVGGDGRLKNLNFNINSKEHLLEVLTFGERVDGSSLFSHIEAGSSDMYVIPKYKTAFVNPFTEIPTLDILCSFFNNEGHPMDESPEVILKKAHDTLKEKTGYTFEAMGELEYYVISDTEDTYIAKDQKGYHEAFPFNKWEEFRVEAMNLIAQVGGKIKYGHSEVGNFKADGKNYEQNEIEFLPVPVEEAADQLVIAKWVLRSLAYQYGLTLTFAPKISLGKAGSGLHIHTRLKKDGKSVMIESGKLSDTAKRMIAGFLDLAPSLTAFGNTNPTSYFRLVPKHEAPTSICWGDRNRSVLVRVPLGWIGNVNMAKIANPEANIENITNYQDSRQTVEFRCPDGSADIYLLLAGLTVAARHGLEMKNALEIAEKKYVGVDIFKQEHTKVLNSLENLPVSCYESSKRLLEQQNIYLQYDVFGESIIKSIAKKLKGFNDKNLRNKIEHRREDIKRMVKDFFYCG